MTLNKGASNSLTVDQPLADNLESETTEQAVRSTGHVIIDKSWVVRKRLLSGFQMKLRQTAIGFFILHLRRKGKKLIRRHSSWQFSISYQCSRKGWLEYC